MSLERVLLPGLPEIEQVTTSRVLFKVVGGTEFRLNHNESPLLIISGTSGAGKDTIVNALPTEKYIRVRTCTTRREVRDDEVDNDPYNRLTVEEFLQQVEQGGFVEHAKYGSNYYGTRKKDIDVITKQKKIPVLRIDPQGAMSYITRQIVVEGHKPIYFFVIPPTLEDMWLRMYGRDVEMQIDPRKRQAGLEKVGERMRLAQQDFSLSMHAHYLLLNPDNQVHIATNALTSKVDELLQNKK